MNNQARTSQLWTSLLDAGHAVEARFEAALSDQGLSLPKLSVLKVLVETGEPIPLSRLAGRPSCVKSNVTQLVDHGSRRMASSGGSATRRDRRTVLAAITDEGRRRYEAGTKILESTEQQVFGAVSDADRDVFAGLLQALSTCRK